MATYDKKYKTQMFRLDVNFKKTTDSDIDVPLFS